MADTVQLLSEIGIRDGSPFESNGITGGDLLDLDEEELKEDLHLTNLQVPCQMSHVRCLTCAPVVSPVMFALCLPLWCQSLHSATYDPMYSRLLLSKLSCMPVCIIAENWYREV